MNNIETEVEVRLPVSEKYLLSIRESAAYFNIGIKKMRRLAEDNLGGFAVFSGNRYLINRTKFERFIEQSSEI
ncbi:MULTISPECIES: excisionase [unclassified Blautia]|uniref:excisionase n=1 Tax=unclassified Blautia TaxID=2648079 RepID=UPI003F8ACC92